LINELADVAGSDVIAILLEHLEVEPLLRLRVRLVGCLGDLLAEERRSEILEEGLGSDSPSCRFLALKLLRRVPRERRRALATAALQVEPDAVLRALLDQVIDYADS
jgi:hypothetical protein